MTKLKSKKMSKSTFAVIIMAILMVAMLAFGGTYAYFTSTAGTAFDSSTNAGIIKLSANGDVFTATSTLTQDVLPGEPLVTLGANDFVVTDESNRASYIFFQYSVEVYKVWTPVYSEEEGSEGTITNEAEKDADGYFKTAASTEISASLSEAFEADNGLTLTALDASNNPGVYYVLTTEGEEGTLEGTYTISIGTENAITIPTTWGNDYQGAKIVVKFAVESIQSYGLDVSTAWSTLHPTENND